MAPMMMEGQETTVLASKSIPNLYPHIDEAKLHRDAAACLANYGTKFEPMIVTGTQGLYFYTSSGHRVLDWTSGFISSVVFDRLKTN